MKGKKLIVLDPITTELAKLADYHIKLRPGTNVAVLNMMLHFIIKSKLYNADFVRDRTEGFDNFLKEIEKQDQGDEAQHWTLTWYDVDSKLGSLYNYVLQMSRFYDPRRAFPSDAFGNDWAARTSVDPTENLKWCKRVEVCLFF